MHYYFIFSQNEFYMQSEVLCLLDSVFYAYIEINTILINKNYKYAWFKARENLKDHPKFLLCANFLKQTMNNNRNNIKLIINAIGILKKNFKL